MSSGVGLEVESGADEDEEDPVALDRTRLHLSPRFTHLAHGVSSSHFFLSLTYQHWRRMQKSAALHTFTFLDLHWSQPPLDLV